MPKKAPDPDSFTGVLHTEHVGLWSNWMHSLLGIKCSTLEESMEPSHLFTHIALIPIKDIALNTSELSILLTTSS